MTDMHQSAVALQLDKSSTIVHSAKIHKQVSSLVKGQGMPIVVTHMDQWPSPAA